MTKLSFKSPQVKMVTIAILSTLGVIGVVLLASWFNFSNLELAASLGMFFGIIGVALGVIILKEKKKVEGMDKGKKLIEVIQRGMDVLPRRFVYACVFAGGLLGIGIILNVIAGKDYMLLLTVVLVNLIATLFVSRKIEIYEKGIKNGLIFVEWKDVEEVKWDKEILLIKTPKIIGSLRIKGKERKIKEIIEKYI